MPRGSVSCELAEHGPEQHAGLIRPLARPDGGAVWATWTTTDEVLCLALYDCSRLGEGQWQPCSLFSAHPGPCSYHRDGALMENPARAMRINAALAVLAAVDQHSMAAVQSAAHDATLLTWDELRARQIWKGLAACDRAAMYGLLARANSVRATASVARTASELTDGVVEMTRLWDPSSPRRLRHGDAAAVLLDALDRLPPEWRVLVLGGQRGHRYLHRMPLDEAVERATRHVSQGLPVPPAGDDWKAKADREGDERSGAVVSERLARLPYGWQIDGVRRIALGADALDTVSAAVMCINVIRVYGIDGASCGTGPANVHLAAVRADPQQA